MRARRVTAVLLVAGIAALAAVPTALGGSTPPKKVVTVGDYYFSPMNFKVKKGTVVAWKWSADNGDSHDVKLVDGPKGVKRFHSEPVTTDYTYRRKLRVKGKYKIVCTLHRGLMRQTITVR